jgi:serine protease
VRRLRHVVVKLRDGVGRRGRTFVGREAGALVRGPRRFDRLFPAWSIESLDRLEARALRIDPTYGQRGLSRYGRLACRDAIEAREVSQHLMTCPLVEMAYVGQPPTASARPSSWVEPGVEQGYLREAPQGIGISHAWRHEGGEGDGQRLVTVEARWPRRHQALARPIARLYGGASETASGHGTAVLGIVCGRDEWRGFRGAVPGLASLGVVACGSGCSAAALLEAARQMRHGDVMLIEVQALEEGGTGLPLEALPAEFDVIRLATALGITVVEAAGNGNCRGAGVDLDAYDHPWSGRLHRAGKDSGAIIVTAATPASPHYRASWAAFGSRVDCYAWGAGIHTCLAEGRRRGDGYTYQFGGTSGAAAIIAGAALAVQGMVEARQGSRLAPRALRRLLSDAETGTPPARDEPTHIGVMPDLRRLVTRVLD